MRLKEIFEELETKTNDTFLSEMYDFLIENKDVHYDLLCYYYINKGDIDNKHSFIYGGDGFVSDYDIECLLEEYADELGREFKRSYYVNEKEFNDNEWFYGHAYGNENTRFRAVTDEDVNEFKNAIKREIELQFN